MMSEEELKQVELEKDEQQQKSSSLSLLRGETKENEGDVVSWSKNQLFTKNHGLCRQELPTSGKQNTRTFKKQMNFC